MRAERDANQRYHDRIAPRYDQVYDTPYWRFYREISWRHLRRFLPAHRPAAAADIGCGTGWFGIRLLKAGMAVKFVDLSRGMLDAAAARIERERVKGEVSFLQHDAEELRDVAEGSLAFATMQGDPLSFCTTPARAVAELHRVLAPGATAVVSADHLAAGPGAYLERGDLAGLRRLLQRGETTWLADRDDERFPMRMFDEQGLRQLFTRAGFEVLSLIGKTCLVQRRHEALLQATGQQRRLVALEESVHSKPSFLGLASHLQLAVRKVGERFPGS